MQRNDAKPARRVDWVSIAVDLVAIIGMVLLVGGLAWVHPGLALALVGSGIVVGLANRSG